MRILQPAEWSKPRGFSHGVEVNGPGRWIVLAGQTGGDEKGDYDPDMAAQVGTALSKKPKESAIPTPNPVAKTVKVLVANRAIAPNTDITKDLIEEAFTLKEFPEGSTGNAITDLTPWLLKSFPNGVPAGVWVTAEMIGSKTLPDAPRDPFSIPKAAAVDPTTPIVTPPEKPEPRPGTTSMMSWV